MEFRLLSYNIHKGIGGIDRKFKLGRIIDTIKHYQPDVALLQEVFDGVKRSKYHKQINILGEELGFEYRLFQANVKRKTGFHGNAILSHFLLINMASINLTVPPKKRRNALAAHVQISQNSAVKNIVVVNVHLGLAAYERAIKVCRLIESAYINSVQKNVTILLGGDFKDVWENLCRKVLNAERFASIPKKSKNISSNLSDAVTR